jgi:hypothetical protein
MEPCDKRFWLVPDMELREPHTPLLWNARQKPAVYFFSALIAVAVAVWIGVLSWGLLTVSQWLFRALR